MFIFTQFIISESFKAIREKVKLASLTIGSSTPWEGSEGRERLLVRITQGTKFNFSQIALKLSDMINWVKINTKMSITIESDHWFGSERPKSGFYGAHFRFSTSLRRNAIKSTFFVRIQWNLVVTLQISCIWSCQKKKRIWWIFQKLLTQKECSKFFFIRVYIVWIQWNSVVTLQISCILSLQKGKKIYEYFKSY